MKQRIINGNPLEFFNSNNLQKAEIKVSGSDIIINPLDTGGKVILGDTNITGSIRVSNNVFLDGVINQDTPQNHVVTFNNTTGQLFITASSAFGGGGGGGSEPGGNTSTIQYNNAGVLDGDDNFKFEASISTVILTGSLITTGDIIGTLIDLDSTGSARITGSLDLEGPLHITGSSTVDPVKVTIPDGNGGDEKFVINNEGVLVLANLTTAPTAITGGIFYSSSQFYLGID